MTTNKGSKMKAGWSRLLKNEKILLTHTNNFNFVNSVIASLHAIANLTSLSKCHSENSPRRLKTDEKAVQDLDSCITEFDCDPFDFSKPTLRSLQSGMVTSDEPVQYFETAHEHGESLVKYFVLLHFICTEVWMISGTAAKRKCYAASERLTQPMRVNLLSFHALTGCDTTSSFHGHGKKLCWKTFLRNNHYSSRELVVPEILSLLSSFNHARLQLFGKAKKCL